MEWSYGVMAVKNMMLNQLEEYLNKWGDAGWELITAVTTVKTMVNISGNDLVFIFKKPRVAGESWPAPVVQ
jgi:hypothetical protein